MTQTLIKQLLLKFRIPYFMVLIEMGTSQQTISNIIESSEEVILQHPKPTIHFTPEDSVNAASEVLTQLGEHQGIWPFTGSTSKKAKPKKKKKRKQSLTDIGAHSITDLKKYPHYEVNDLIGKVNRQERELNSIVDKSVDDAQILAEHVRSLRDNLFDIWSYLGDKSAEVWSLEQRVAHSKNDKYLKYIDKMIEQHRYETPRKRRKEILIKYYNRKP